MNAIYVLFNENGYYKVCEILTVCLDKAFTSGYIDFIKWISDQSVYEPP